MKKYLLAFVFFNSYNLYSLDFYDMRIKGADVGSLDSYFSSWNYLADFNAGLSYSFSKHEIDSSEDTISFNTMSLNLSYLSDKDYAFIVDLPLHYVQGISSTHSSLQKSGFFFGDISLALPISVIRKYPLEGFGLSLIPSVEFSIDDNNSFISDKKTVFGVRFALDYMTVSRWRLVSNLGFQYRNFSPVLGIDYGMFVKLNLGSYLPFGVQKNFYLYNELYYGFPFKHSARVGTKSTPFEFRSSLGYKNKNAGIDFFVGGAYGLNSHIGTPDFRIFSGLSLRVGDGNSSEYKGAISDVRVEIRDIDKDPTHVTQLMIPDDTYGWTKYDPADTSGYDRSSKNIKKSRYKGRELNVQKLHFVADGRVIEKRHIPILDEVVKIMNSHLSILLLSVEGHADSHADNYYNYNLSRDRAKAVKDYLISRGVNARRLITRRFGEDRPIAANNIYNGRAANRRVEFVIQEVKENISQDLEKNLIGKRNF